MSITAITLIFVAAMAHASWNLFSKQASASGTARFAWVLAVGASLAYAPVVAGAVAVGHPHLKVLNWVFLVGTGLLQSGYFLLLQSGYRLGDLSVAYPIGRGSGALFAAIGGVVLLGERPGPVTAAGIAAIIVGVVAIGIPSRPAASLPGANDLAARPPTDPPSQARQPTAAPVPIALAFALATGVFIAAYTIWDKYAVATLHTPPLLQGYAAFPIMTVVFAPFALRDSDRLRQVWRAFRPQVIGAALLAPLAYILVLVALSFTAVSVVAPAREISVLLGILLGRRLLGEANLARRLAAGAAIVAGIIVIAIG